MPPAIFAPAPEPTTALGRHRILSPHAGVRVSPLQLGAMSIGSAWSDFMGTMDKDSSFKLLDAFVAAGGNFIDTANNYQDEESETIIGEWMAERKNRDRIILATKFTTNYRSYADGKNESINNSGNHKKSLHLSLRDSLRKLQTDYVDILYLHWWDWTTSIEEVMHSLDVLVKQGKVLYLGISDTPAWIVSAANTYAREKGLTPFVIYQGRWSLLDRSFERDIIPMARQFGLALAPWGAMAQGRLQSKKQLEERKKNGERFRTLRGGPEQTEEEERFSTLLSKIAAEHNIESVTAIALAYVLSKTPYVFPIIGGRKVEHLHDNIQALSIKLTAEQIKKIEDAKDFQPGFPHDMIGGDSSIAEVDQAFLVKASGTLDLVKGSSPL